MRVGVQLGIAVTVLATLTPVVRAAEMVTLTNGFAMRCDHHEKVQGRIRLYLDAGENSYIEFGPGQIKGFTQVADTPVSPAAAANDAAHAQREVANLSPADLQPMLAQAGHEHNIDVDLLASVVKAESGGNARAVSRAGAKGLMQLMPGTAAGLGVEDSFRPGENVRGGSAYLDALLTRYHDNLALALAAYNAGPEAVDRYHGIPPYHETRVYVARVIHEFNRRVKARRAGQAREFQEAATKVTAPIQ